MSNAFFVTVDESGRELAEKSSRFFLRKLKTKKRVSGWIWASRLTFPYWLMRS